MRIDKLKIYPPQKRKKFACICKKLDGTFMKHRTSDLVQYVKWLDRDHTGWRWFNVFANDGPNRGEQLASFTKSRRPTNRDIEHL